MADFLTARGIDPSRGNVPADILEQARTHAIQDAKRATFQDASALADAIARIENKNKATRLAIGGLLPFKRTPINIAKRGFELSPAGLIKGLTYDLGQVRKGTMTATDAIDHISQGLTGTSRRWWVTSLRPTACFPRAVRRTIRSAILRRLRARRNMR